MSSLPFSAVLLAAGRSSRMGRDKALLAADDGRLLWQRQRDLLAAAGATEIFLSAREDQTWAASADGFTAVVHDAVVDSGPLGGIVAALERAKATHVAVLAIDLPQMQPGWFATLRSLCAPAVGAVGRRETYFEPLAAIYPRELLAPARHALERGELSLQRLLTAAVTQGLMRSREIAPSERSQFENWNERPEQPRL